MVGLGDVLVLGVILRRLLVPEETLRSVTRIGNGESTGKEGLWIEKWGE